MQLGLSQQAVSEWFTKGRIPPKRLNEVLTALGPHSALGVTVVLDPTPRSLAEYLVETESEVQRKRKEAAARELTTIRFLRGQIIRPGDKQVPLFERNKDDSET